MKIRIFLFFWKEEMRYFLIFSMVIEVRVVFFGQIGWLWFFLQFSWSLVFFVQLLLSFGVRVIVCCFGFFKGSGLQFWRYKFVSFFFFEAMVGKGLLGVRGKGRERKFFEVGREGWRVFGKWKEEERIFQVGRIN